MFFTHLNIYLIWFVFCSFTRSYICIFFYCSFIFNFVFILSLITYFSLRNKSYLKFYNDVLNVGEALCSISIKLFIYIYLSLLLSLSLSLNNLIYIFGLIHSLTLKIYFNLLCFITWNQDDNTKKWNERYSIDSKFSHLITLFIC